MSFGVDPRNPLDYVGPHAFLVPCVTFPSAPLSTDYNFQINTIWRVGKGPQGQPPSTGVIGDQWILVDKTGVVGLNAFADWKQFVFAGIAPGGVVTLTGDDGFPVVETAGNIDVLSNVVPNAGVPIATLKAATSELDIDIQVAGVSATTDLTAVGLSAFDSAHFMVDSNGFVDPTPGITSGAPSSFANAGVLSADQQQFTIDPNGWLQLKAGTNTYGVGNLSIGYVAGVFTVAGFDGAALSASNPGIVWLQDKASPGRLRRYLVTANQTFTDGSAGQIDNMRWGVTTAVNWSTDAPFFLYAVTNDALDTIAFAVSRVPHLTSSPVAAKLGKQGAVVNVSQSDMYLLPNVTVADYEQNPCLLLGSFRMQFAGSTDSWTVQTLDASDGIGRFNDERWFVFPDSQMGATTATYFLTQGGTQPTFNVGASSVSYRVSQHGTFDYSLLLVGCTLAGTGTEILTAVLPFNVDFTGSQGPFGQFMGSLNVTGVSGNFMVGALISPNELVFSNDGAMSDVLQSGVALGDAFQGFLNAAMIQK